MSLKQFYIISIIAFASSDIIANSSSQAQDPISSDSLISLNEHAFSFIYSDPDSANYFSELAYKISVIQNDSVAIARSIVTIASVKWAEAKFNLALKYTFDALNRYEILEDTVGILRCYNNIAESYKKLKNYSNANRYLFDARKLHQIFYLDKYPILNTLNIAELFLEEKNYDSAGYYLNKAKSAPNSQLTISLLATINYNYAILNKDTSNFDMAITFIEQCLHFTKIESNPRKTAEANNVLGEILIEQNKHSEALSWFNKALDIAIELNHEHLELRIQKNLYLLELEKGNTIKAITHILRYTELKDKIYTISIARQSAEFETVYELEKIEQENGLLQLRKKADDKIIKYQIGFIILALIALVIAVYLLLAINKQRKSLKQAFVHLEEQSQIVETQKLEIEKQSSNTNALNKELTLLNKNLDARAQEIAREIEEKNKKMNKYAFMNAHKLRAPIASILGLINLFGKNISPTDETQMIKMLKDSAHTLDEVVHEIKDIIDE